ncbi:extensin-like domain-containing protein [Salinarimonas chemoclinalis]|uniref:extensin-like domain-containing protein n=1 Tax=Salinarimonas chemoclinalis TaxID=3241599 RepID=UPI00355753C9
MSPRPSLPRRVRSRLAGAAIGATTLSMLLVALPVDARDPPPRPPERPAEFGRIDTDPPLPVARPVLEEQEDGPERPEVDARTDESPLPPARPVVVEPEAVLPDAPRRPLETDPAERAAHEACLADLDARGVVYEEMPPIDGEGRCGAAFPLLVRAVRGIALEPSVTVRCSVARALDGWVEEALLPAAREHLDARPTTLSTGGSYACRGRNRQEDARLSEHAFANALDITGIGFETRAAVPVAPRGDEDGPQAAFQREIRRGACAHFRTVLGPGADAHHDDHLHFDQRQRTNDYRLCE